ncbi:histidine phosphatase family protein [Aeromicrobium sp.]
MSRQIILWRHGQTAWNAAGRVQGQSDVPLDEVGVAQAGSAAARLATLNPARILTSDLSRASATAQALSDLTGIPFESDKRLREMAFGLREGLTSREAWESHPHEMRAFFTGDDVRMPGGETYREAGKRFAEVLTEVGATVKHDRPVVIVAHGAVLRVGACTFVGISQEYWRSFGGLSNCSWSVLEESRFGDRTIWRITEWNAGTLPEPVLSDDT